MAGALPNFDLDAYAELLADLRANGYRFSPVADLPRLDSGRHALLRHDIDLDPSPAVAMAERERAAGVKATYYILLTQHFNVLSMVNRSVIAELRALGHEIGLHYDMQTYPQDPEQARAHLDWELGILSTIAQAPVRTLCMHRPYLGHRDPFRSLPYLVHPHDPRLQEGLMYVSDSCRAWRDDSLLQAFSATPPARLLLNLHPELWLDGSERDPLRYMSETVMSVVTSRARAFVEDELEPWHGHATAPPVF